MMGCKNSRSRDTPTSPGGGDMGGATVAVGGAMWSASALAWRNSLSQAFRIRCEGKTSEYWEGGEEA